MSQDSIQVRTLLNFGRKNHTFYYKINQLITVIFSQSNFFRSVRRARRIGDLPPPNATVSIERAFFFTLLKSGQYLSQDSIQGRTLLRYYFFGPGHYSSQDSIQSRLQFESLR